MTRHRSYTLLRSTAPFTHNHVLLPSFFFLFLLFSLMFSFVAHGWVMIYDVYETNPSGGKDNNAGYSLVQHVLWKGGLWLAS